MGRCWMIWHYLELERRCQVPRIPSWQAREQIWKNWRRCGNICAKHCSSVGRMSFERSWVLVQLYWREFKSRPRHKVVGNSYQHHLLNMEISCLGIRSRKKLCRAEIRTRVGQKSSSLVCSELVSEPTAAKRWVIYWKLLLPTCPILWEVNTYLGLPSPQGALLG